MPNPTDDPKTNEPTADGHVVLPVANGDRVDHIAFPASTPLPVVHKALLDHVQPPDVLPDSRPSGVSRDWAPYQGANVDSFGRPKAGPSRQGVLENDPKFKAAARAIYDASGRGRNPNEAGTYVDANLDRGPIAVSNTEGKMSLVVPADAKQTLHTHPSHFNGATASPLPSGTDVDTAKKLKRSVYVVSPEGLSVVEGDGKVTNIYNDSGWLDRNNK